MIKAADKLIFLIIFTVVFFLSCSFEGADSLVDGTGNAGVTTAEAARIYYVSSSSGEGGDGSSAAPLESIQKAAKVARPGDTVIVKDGVYTDLDGDGSVVRLNRGGTADNWITFKSEHKWGAVLDCMDNKTNFGWLFSRNSAYIRVEDFEIKGCAWSGLHNNAQGHHIYIYGNKVHDIGRVCTTITKGRDGVFQGRDTSFHTYDSNIFYSIGRLPGCGDPDHLYQHDHGIYAFGRDNTIINNIFYDLEAGWGIQLSGGKGITDGPNWKVINNTFVGANPRREGQIIIWTEKNGNHPTNVTIENNISYAAKGGFINFGTRPGGPDYKINNNLVYGDNTALVSYVGLFAPEYSAADNIIGKDPLFLDAANKDFHLQPSSPAIGKGRAADAPPYDFEKKKRSLDAACDIGAYAR